MMLLELLAIFACAAFSSAATSPHAEYVEQMIKSGSFKIDPRLIDNVLEDASLDVVSFKQK